MRWLQVHCSLGHYQWLRRDGGELIIQHPVIHLSLLISLSDSVFIGLSLILSLPLFSVCVARTCRGQRQSCGFFWGGIRAKLPPREITSSLLGI